MDDPVTDGHPAAERHDTAPVSAIVTAWRRIEQTLETISRLEACRPAPDEIIVHVDGAQTACASAVRVAFPCIEVIVSETSVGPGGGRNKLIAAAKHELIGSFDDDSYPVDADFFARAKVLAAKFPDAALYGAAIFHKNEACPADEAVISRTSSFGAGGVVFRRSAYLAAGGFVPLVVAYGMEEEDLALRMMDQGHTLLYSPWLRVFHDNDLSHHESARITSGAIANLALLAWLRYPLRYWPYGVLQIANRVVWCWRVGRRAGILSGLAAIPGHIARHWSLREPVSAQTMAARAAARVLAFKPFAPE